MPERLHDGLETVINRDKNTRVRGYHIGLALVKARLPLLQICDKEAPYGEDNRADGIDTPTKNCVIKLRCTPEL